MTYDCIITKPELDELYLEHFGIKGQKWGVEHGPPYPLGSESSTGRAVKKNAKPKKTIVSKLKDKKASYDKKVEKKYKQTEEKYKKLGMSDEEAHQKIEAKKKVDKILKISAGVAVAALATYGAYKYFHNPVKRDQFIPKGAKLDTLTNFKDRAENGYYYAALEKNKGDIMKYRAGWGSTNKLVKDATGKYITQKENKLKLQTKTTDKIKVASHKTAMKTFQKMMKDDPEFKAAVEKSVELHKPNGFFGINKYKWNELKTDKERFMAFSQRMADRTAGGHDLPHYSKFMWELKKQGYGALVDSNDLKGAGGFGYQTKNPIILFDNSKYVTDTIKQLSDKEIADAGEYQKKVEKIKEMTGTIGMNVLPAVAAGGIGIYANSFNPQRIKQNQLKEQTKTKKKK